jgi:MerR family transcriptional regulator, heat shock protein HspR
MRGLVEPHRSSGGTRRCSAPDVVRLQRVAELLCAGLNLAGASMMLRLEADDAQLHEQPRAHHLGERRAAPRRAR